MALCEPDSTMALFKDLLHAADDNALGFDALLRECSVVEVCAPSRVRRHLRFALGPPNHYVRDLGPLLFSPELMGSQASAFEVKYWYSGPHVNPSTPTLDGRQASEVECVTPDAPRIQSLAPHTSFYNALSKPL
jgi:hypothetical protein